MQNYWESFVKVGYMHIQQVRNSRYLFNRNVFISASNNMYKDVHRSIIIIIKNWKQLKYPSTLKGPKKKWYILEYIIACILSEDDIVPNRVEIGSG